MSIPAEPTSSIPGPATNDGGLAQAIIAKLDTYQYPVVYAYVQWALVAFGAVYLLLFFISVFIVAIPLYRGPSVRHKHLWLWRREYISRYSVPYYVPNGGMAVVISQIIGCIVGEIYIVLCYLGIRSRGIASNHDQFFWLTISFTPAFFGGWYSRFSAVYISLFSPSRPTSGTRFSRKHMPHPIFMNIVCIGVPILVALGALACGITATVTLHEKKAAYDAVVSHLALGQNPALELERYARASTTFIAQFKWTSIFWGVAALVNMFFHFLAIFLLIPLLKATVDVASGKSDLLDRQEKAMYSTKVDKLIIIRETFQNKAPSNSLHSQRLQKAYRLLTWHCGVVAILLAWYSILGIVTATQIQKVMHDEAWRSAEIWTFLTTSVFISGALLLQSWRIFSDQDETV